MVQTVHSRRKDDRLTLAEQLHLWSGVALVVIAILILAVMA